MTKPVRASSRILKDANGVDINDHLRNHIHLTNCIHLKNHIHKQTTTPLLLGDRSLMRDLVVLRRSRSLKDPSASPPPSWPAKGDRDEQGGRNSVGIVGPGSSSSRRLSGSSHPLSSKVVPDDGVSGDSGSKDGEIRRKSKHSEEVVVMESDVASSNIHRKGKTESRNGGYGRVRRRRGGARRSRVSSSRDRKEMSIGSNSLPRSSVRPMHNQDEYEDEEEEECGDQNVAQGPRNGCGIPWNWSRIHDRSRMFLDKAGRSLSCGRSESRSGRSRSMDDDDMMPMTSGFQSSSESRSGWIHDYSGELGFYADSLLRKDVESATKRGQKNCRHQNLTQKYTPRTFRDLVGQNLVCQALSNAVIRRRIGLLYVFYGPHGTGKTSSARIFARALNCQSVEPPKPCGNCNSCTAHETGKNRYIREIGPASSFNSSKTVTDLLLTSQHHYKVLIFDDCDALSPDCWGAISKVPEILLPKVERCRHCTHSGPDFVQRRYRHR
ncbi:Protein STICHEL-like 3 [Linum grandiflorum]